jgi:hypothetical protein
MKENFKLPSMWIPLCSDLYHHERNIFSWSLLIELNVEAEITLLFCIQDDLTSNLASSFHGFPQSGEIMEYCLK